MLDIISFDRSTNLLCSLTSAAALFAISNLPALSPLNFSLNKLSDTFGKEQVYGTQGTFGGEPVDMTNYQPSNRFAGFKLGMASGGIASLTKTIPPESGPTPHGLPYVYNNVKKI